MGVLSCTIYTNNIFSISSQTPNKLNIVKHIFLLHKIQILHFVPIDEESQSMEIIVKKITLIFSCHISVKGIIKLILVIFCIS
jgi:hypothetical protein